MIQTTTISLAGKKEPKKIYYIGNIELLKSPKIAIVGSRKALTYSKNITYQIAREFSKRGYTIINGGALGIDRVALEGAGAKNSIAILGSGLNYLYPSTNKDLFEKIKKEGLLISPFDIDFKPTKWSFVVRNEIVVNLAKFLIITEASLKSGSMSSANFAKKLKKDIYVIPHRINDSLGTLELLKNKEAKLIYNIEEFANSFKKITLEEDPFIKYLKSNPLYTDAMAKYPDKILEAEINGLIEVKDARVYLK